MYILNILKLNKKKLLYKMSIAFIESFCDHQGPFKVPSFPIWKSDIFIEAQLFQQFLTILFCFTPNKTEAVSGIVHFNSWGFYLYTELNSKELI